MDANHFYGEMIAKQDKQIELLQKVLALLEAGQQPTPERAPNKRTRTAAEPKAGEKNA